MAARGGGSAEVPEGPPCLAALSLGRVDGSRVVGLAFLTRRARTSLDDRRHSCLETLQTLDSEHFTLLEAALVKMQPSVLYLSDAALSRADLTKITQICEGAQCVVEVVPKSTFKLDRDELLAGLARLLGESAESIATHPHIAPGGGDLLAPQHREASAALQALLRKEGLADDGQLAGCFELQRSDIHAFMRLDQAAVRSLNILPASAREAAGSAITSLLALVSHGCSVKGGVRLLRRWLLQPLVDLEALTERQNIVASLVADAVLREGLRDRLRMPDLEALSARLHRKVGPTSLVDLCRLYAATKKLDALVALLRSHAGDHAPLIEARFVEKLAWAVGEFARFEELVEQVVEDPTSPEPRIRPNWSPALQELSERVQETLHAMERCHSRVQRMLGAGLDVKCERDKQHGAVFRTSRTNDRDLRQDSSIVVLAVVKDGIRFTTLGSDGLQSLARDLADLEGEYAVAQRSIVAHVVDIARSYAPVVEATASVIAELDAFRSLAHLAVTAPGTYVRPTLLPFPTTPAERRPGSLASTPESKSTDDDDATEVAATKDVAVAGLSVSVEHPRVNVRRARHPLIEMQEGVSFIPNDFVMDLDANGHFHLITGPNMGGKSTYIRQLGTLAVLAQIGSYVPADSATLPIFDSVLARVGAGDAQLRGVSTFMAEMLEAASILTTATPASLVIIDELGRGTSTYDGYGLAWAISEHLADRVRGFTLFATHFHELTALADVVRGVRNRHVSAHTTAETITMLYTVQDGACSASFGIHVAELAAFPPEVVAEARRKASELESLAQRGRELLEQLARGETTAALVARMADDRGDDDRGDDASDDAQERMLALALKAASATDAAAGHVDLAAARAALRAFAVASSAREE